MTGVEIDFAVSDSRRALALYERIFDVERIEVTDFAKGANEAVFAIYGTRFHMLDESPPFGLFAPEPGRPNSIWFNVTVPDIAETHGKALAAGCTEMQPVTEMPDFGVSNAMFTDPFGYMWMLHQVHRVVGFEERCALMEHMGHNG